MTTSYKVNEVFPKGRRESQLGERMEMSPFV